MTLSHSVSVAMLLAMATPALAQKAQRDPGCKDHPLVARVEGKLLEDCRSRLFDEYDFVMGPPADGGTPTLQRHEGKLHETTYRHPRKIAADVLAEYRAALEKQGFTRVYQGDESDFTRVLTMKHEKPNEAWVQIVAETFNEGEFAESRVAVLESTPLPNRLQKAAAKGGKDAPGCRDLPFVGRIQGAWIEECGQRRDVTSTLVASKLGDAGTTRGDLTRVSYIESPQTSAFEVVETFEAALTKDGWELVDRADGGAQYVLLARKSVEGVDTWLTVSAEGVNDDRWVRTVLSAFVPRAEPQP